MGMNCDACLDRCKADCCHGPVAMTKEFIQSHTPIRPILLMREEGDGLFAPIAHDERHQGPPGEVFGVCPFLGFDDKCSVYVDRPQVCRNFGQPTITMICSYQAHDGRIRGDAERNWIEDNIFAPRNQIIDEVEEGTSPIEVLPRWAELQKLLSSYKPE